MPPPGTQSPDARGRGDTRRRDLMLQLSSPGSLCSSMGSARSRRRITNKRSPEEFATGSGQSPGAPPTPQKARNSGPSDPGVQNQQQSQQSRTVDIWDHEADLDDIYGKDCVGAARIEKAFELYGDPPNEYIDIPWSDATTGADNVVADPMNRPLQDSTVSEYTDRLLRSGLAEDCSGVMGFN